MSRASCSFFVLERWKNVHVLTFVFCFIIILLAHLQNKSSSRVDSFVKKLAKKNLNFWNLHKMLKRHFFISVPPEVPKIQDSTGFELPAHAGPYEEGGNLELTCVVTGGKCPWAEVLVRGFESNEVVLYSWDKIFFNPVKTMTVFLCHEYQKKLFWVESDLISIIAKGIWIYLKITHLIY